MIFKLKDSIDGLKNYLPVVEELSNPALKTRHWAEIFRIVGFTVASSEDGTGFEDFSVQDLLACNILDKLESVQALSCNASKEYSLEKALEKMKGDWEGVEFRVIEYKDTGTFIIGGTDEIQARRFFFWPLILSSWNAGKNANLVCTTIVGLLFSHQKASLLFIVKQVFPPSTLCIVLFSWPAIVLPSFSCSWISRHFLMIKS